MIHFKLYTVKLNYLLIISAILVVTYCAPLPQDSEASITNYENTNDGKGNYHFRFDTSNGITREETGTLVDIGLPNEHVNVKGSFAYTDPEGKLVTVNYTADENGYVLYTPEPPILVMDGYAAPINPAVLASLLG